MTELLIPDAAFPPGRNEPCFCGSGERFKRCCGSAEAGRAPPYGIGIVEDFLSARECRSLVGMAEAMEGQRFMMRDRARNEEIVPDPTRVCDWMKLGDQQKVLDEVVTRAFEEQIIPKTGTAISWYEEPQLLRYLPGGYYRYHSDDSYLVPEQQAWRKAVDRDISLLIYINDDFTGGELEFRRFSYFLKPRAGMLVWFPSNMRYEHMAQPVKSGRRYAIVSWAAAEGVERVQAARAKRSILWSTRRKQDEV